MYVRDHWFDQDALLASVEAGLKFIFKIRRCRDGNRDAEDRYRRRWRYGGLGCPLLSLLRDERGSPRHVDLILQVGIGKRGVLPVDCCRASDDRRGQTCTEQRGA